MGERKVELHIMVGCRSAIARVRTIHPRRSTALARAATNAGHLQFGDPAGFRCCVTRTPRHRAERGDIGVFEGEAREGTSPGSQERPLFGTGVYPLPPHEKRRSVPDGARDGATTHQMRHHGRRAGGAGGKACSTNCSRPSDSFNHP